MSAAQSRPAIDAAFRATTYRVDGGERVFELHVGARHPALDAFLAAREAHCWAVVTAANPGAAIRPADENAAAHRRLLAAVDRLGRHWLPATNVARDGDWPVEPGVMIVAIERETARALAQEFGQLACLWGSAGRAAELVWTDERSAPAGV